jgi:outer membrane protein OmpA-like peptidoglycan-associated protein
MENILDIARHALDHVRARVQGIGGEAAHRGERAVEDLRGPSNQWKGLAWLLAGFAAVALLGLALFRTKAPEPVQGLDMPTPAMPEGRAAPATPAIPESPQNVAEPNGPMTGADEATDRLSPSTGAGALAKYLASSNATPHRFVLSGISFTTASAQTAASSTMLNEAAAALRAHPNTRVVLEGYADSIGPATTNQSLSQARAEAVKGYFVARGVPTNQIEAVGRGSDRPIAPGKNPDALATNRRVELVVIER